MKRLCAALISAATLSACSAGIERTPGMELFSAGNVAAAIPVLEREVKAGQVPARYSLGLAYRDGTGVPPDARKAELLLTGAAIGGDPRAVSAVRDLLANRSACAGDQELRRLWGGVGTMNRNLVTGVVELNTASPSALRRMADLYETPCAGVPPQVEAARSLRSLSNGPRYIWVYVP